MSAKKEPIRKVEVQVVTGGVGHCSDNCPFNQKLGGWCGLFRVNLEQNPRRKHHTSLRARECMLNDLGGEMYKNKVK